jgi:collagenase-like PrtC family protease
VLALHAALPKLALHFSTQTCVCNSADVAAAGELGAARVVLARELSLDEIAAAGARGKVETEVFVQGALCFSVSGRCLLSSWFGGRSGNRGACTSPCRVPWSRGDEPPGTPLSMRDLSAVGRVEELRRAGVRGLKIEGRLKNAAWVGEAVSLCRHALDGAEVDTETLCQAAAKLGGYTGREMTCGYLDAERAGLTGWAAGRASGRAASETAEPNPTADEPATVAPPAESAAAEPAEEDPDLPHYDLHVDVEPQGIVCRCECGGQKTEWTIPKTVVRRAEKAVAIGRAMERFEAATLQGFRLGLGTTNDPEFLLVPRAFNALVDRVTAVLRTAQKAPSEQVKFDLPPAVRELLARPAPHPNNKLCLGEAPDRVRVEAAAAPRLLREVLPKEIIVEGVTPGTLRHVLAACEGAGVIVALPPVFFESDVPGIARLAERCARAGVTVEVNSWGGWRLARQARTRIEAGPGLPVLNSLAAGLLSKLGARCVTLSPEADRRQLEEVSACCPAPCSLVVFGRPRLMTTRVDLPESEFAGQTLTDRRGGRIAPRREGGLWVFRPEEAFDLRNLENPRIRVRHLVVDLVGSPDPVGDWHDVPLPGWKRFRFNYDRSLA